MKPDNLLSQYRKHLNPPYKGKDLIVIALTLIILITIPLTSVAVRQSREPASQAVGTARIYVSPPSQSVVQNTTFSVQVREDSGVEPVNAVQAVLTFDTARLEASSIDSSSSAFQITAQETIGTGTITIARGVSGGNPPLTGDKLVAIINFKAKINPGGTTVNFASGTVLIRSTDNTDILGTMTPGTYTITNPIPNVNITQPLNNQVVAGNVTINANASDDQGVTKVEFIIDGSVRNTDTSVPYSYVWQTVAGDTGVHTIVAKAYDTQGSTNTNSITVTVDNQAPTVPTALTATPVSGTQINLSWNPSTDNLAVTGYEIYRSGSKIATVTATNYSDTGLIAGTSYSYFVKAGDAMGNISGQSNTVNATTIRPGDANKDGKVDIFDLSILLTHWQTVYPAADFNGNGTVDIFDLSILLTNWTG